MTKFQVGELVEAIENNYCYTSKINGWKGIVTKVYPNGFFDAKTIESEDADDVKSSTLYTRLSPSQFRLIEPKKTEEPQSIFQRMNSLEKEVAELKKVVEGFKPNPKNTIRIEVDTTKLLDSINKATPKHSSLPQSNNQKRAAIIKKAKRFVEEILGKYECFPTKIGFFENQQVQATFHVNAKKHAVVVLIHGHFSKKLYSKGIAKCHPNDVFNEHIGKAIALGRALGLDVSEFEQAVQPDEVVVGMEVATTRDYPESVDGLVKKGDVFKIVDRVTDNKEAQLGSGISENCRITNDSQAQYEEVK